MKRVSTSKVKIVATWEAANDGLEGFKPVQPMRQVRTRVATIGLAISMGASSLLLTRQSDRALAAEPVGNDPTVSPVPAATFAAQRGSITPVEKYQVNATQVAASNSLAQRLAATATDQQLQVGEPPRVTSEVSALLKPKQRVLINRLKQKSNRLKDSLAQLKSEESNNLSAPATKLAFPASAVEKTQTTKQARLAPLVADVLLGQQQADSLSPSDAVVVPDVPSAVDEPTVVVPSVSLDHQVKAGDTLTAIAHKHRIPLSKLVSANYLSDPNLLQINQRLTIPLQSSSTSDQTVAVIKHPTNPKTTSSVAVPTLKTALSNPTVLVVPPLPFAANNSSNFVATLAMTNLQANAKLIAYNPAEGSQQENLAVQSQLAQSRLVKPKPQSNPYLQNLGTDIQRLREKYYAQKTGSRVSINPQYRTNRPANEPINLEFRAAQAAETLQPAIQKRIDIDASQSLQSPTRQTVAPELPPLGGLDTYLPKPFDTSVHFKGYIWPAKGVLTSGYGWRWGRMHKGIDITASVGTPIVAAAPGVVVKSGWSRGGYGNLVDIRHPNGTLTRYAHNKRVLVQAGQLVEQGQLIAEMGSTGRSTGPHSHFELHSSSKGAVNPIAYLPR